MRASPTCRDTELPKQQNANMPKIHKCPKRKLPKMSTKLENSTSQTFKNTQKDKVRDCRPDRKTEKLKNANTPTCKTFKMSYSAISKKP